MSGIYRRAQQKGRCRAHPRNKMAFTCEQCGRPRCEDCAAEVVFLRVLCVDCAPRERALAVEEPETRAVMGTKDR
jgi:hypothetical protein